MNRKARLWTGATIMAVLLLNYAIFTVPLVKKTASIDDKVQTIMKKMIESRKGTTGEDQYMLQIFLKERSSIDGKLAILNILTISFAIIIASWTVFGLMFHKEKK